MKGNGILSGEELELLRKNKGQRRGSGLYRVHKYKYDGYRRGKCFVVQKTINGKDCFFGKYPSEETAQRMVEDLKKVDWDKRQYPAIRARLRKEGYEL